MIFFQQTISFIWFKFVFLKLPVPTMTEIENEKNRFDDKKSVQSEKKLFFHAVAKSTEEKGSKIDSQSINKTLADSEHATEAPVKGELLVRIAIYLDSGGGVVGAEVLRLLRDVDAYLRNKTTAEITITPQALQESLQKMQHSLDRIESNG